MTPFAAGYNATIQNVYLNEFAEQYMRETCLFNVDHLAGHTQSVPATEAQPHQNHLTKKHFRASALRFLD